MNWLHQGALAAWLALAALAAPGGLAHAQESAVVKRATQLRDAPSDSGASVATLDANSIVTRSSERKGAWTRVSTAQGATGWVHMFDLGPQSGSASTAGVTSAASPGNGVANVAASGLRSLGGLFGGSGQTTTATSTVGIRGLGAEDIAHAQPNPAAVQQAEALRVSADQAREFATQAPLQPRSVPALAAPAMPPGATPAGGAATPWSTPVDASISPN